MTRSGVHVRLRASGVDTSTVGIADDVRSQVRAYYERTSHHDFDLSALADSVGMSRTSVCNLARSLGLTRGERAKVTSIRGAKAPGHANLGRTASPETRAKLSATSRAAWAAARLTQTGHRAPERLEAMRRRLLLANHNQEPSARYSRTKKGRRPDLGETCFRSGWEANYARYLNLLMANGEIQAWDYEPDVFRFADGTLGVRSYRPDFRIGVQSGDTHYVEVKGWMDAASALRLQRMALEFPAVDLRLVDQNAYRAIAREVRHLLPNWEGAA